MRRILPIVAALLLGVLLLPSVAPAASGPTITSPVEGAYVTTAQPTFTGTGDGSDTVVVNIYAGAAASGIPVAVADSTVANGSWSALPAVGLPNGTFTAEAVETDSSSGATADSQTVTFTLFSSTPGLTLSLPSNKVTDPTPTFSGTAPTGGFNSQSIAITIYPGTSTDSTPLGELQGSLQSDGTFSIQDTLGLGNGSYTAVASQSLGPGGNDFSPTLSFTVVTAPPALTVTDPTANGTEAQTSVVFSGAAGNNYGDSQTVSVTLYEGSTTAGKKLGTKTTTRTKGSWQLTWASRLALGTYTLVATQSNVLGQTTTITRTFTVAPPGVLRGTPTISATGVVAAGIACPSGSEVCSGDVLILSQKKLQPIAGGPIGVIRLLFRHYSVHGGATVTLTTQLGRAQLDALKRAGAEKLTVTTVYALGAKLAETSASTRAVKVA